MPTKTIRKRTLALSVTSLVAIMAVFVVFLALAAQVRVAEALAPGARVEQCANGNMGQYRDCRETGNVGWKNSQVNTNNGHYAEGDYMPYRQLLDGLVAGNQYCFGFGWDITQGALPAVDYIATFTEDLDLADPTFQTIYDGDLATPDDRIAIPDDPVINYGYWTAPANVFTGTLPATRELVIWGGTFDSVGPYSWDLVVGNPPVPTDISLAANEQNSFEYCIIANSTEAVIAWSGHIAVPEEWGAVDRPGGSPYHMSNGTRHDQFTAPRTSMTDLACVDPQGNITHQNIGRNETQLQVGETPTAINLQEIEIGQVGISPAPWIAAFIGFTFLTGLFVLRRRHDEKTEQVRQ